MILLNLQSFGSLSILPFGIHILSGLSAFTIDSILATGNRQLPNSSGGTFTCWTDRFPWVHFLMKEMCAVPCSRLQASRIGDHNITECSWLCEQLDKRWCPPHELYLNENLDFFSAVAPNCDWIKTDIENYFERKIFSHRANNGRTNTIWNHHNINNGIGI